MTQNADYVRVIERRYRSAWADIRAAADAEDRAYWLGTAHAYEDCVAILNPSYRLLPPEIAVLGHWRCGFTGLEWDGDISDHHGVEPYCPGPHLRVSHNDSSGTE
jgi:hypothetical protein